jgi:hypothetical protein
LRISDCGLRIKNPTSIRNPKEVHAPRRAIRNRKMPDRTTNLELPTAVRGALDAVRRRIRTYVWIDGVAKVIIALGFAFWVGLALDWVFEPSADVRRIAIVAVALFTLYVSYRYLLRRAFVPISDTSAAILLERRFPGLKDHVITAVDVASGSDRAATYHPGLLLQTNQAANSAVAAVNPSDIFNRRPLLQSIMGAAAVIVSLVAFAFAYHETFGFWLDRIALSENLWPRRVRLEVVGFEPDANGDRTHKIAQDDDYELLVHARTDGYEVPDELEIRYRLADGRRGRDTLVRVGEARASREDFQLFRYEFKRVAGDMDFDVVGGDDRVRDLHLHVVERPELVAIELECVYPEYLGRPSRRLPVTGGMRIPEGTRISLLANSTKPIVAARVHEAKDKHDTDLAFAGEPQQKLHYDYGSLTADDVLLVTATDNDGVATREPYRVSLSVVKDELPQVAVRLSGISTAITPDAILPIVGKITDDYALNRAWFEYQVDGGPVATRPVPYIILGQTAFDKLDAFDTRANDPATGKRALQLKPKQKLSLSLKASDRFNLSKQSRAGSSQQFILEVVTPADLLVLLERRELALRQRFEAIYEKLTDTRNLLNRVGSNETPTNGATPPASSSNKKDEKSVTAADETAASSTERLLSRTRLRVAGSLQNVVQSTDEVAGVAEAFDDLGLELTNNRIDNADLRSRLGEQIARPLHQIAKERMPKLSEQIKLVEEHVTDLAAMAPELKKSIALADQILVEMQQVLNRMLELQTYNEVVTLLRDIISDQNQINQRTDQRKKERIRSLFQD